MRRRVDKGVLRYSKVNVSGIGFCLRDIYINILALKWMHYKIIKFG